MSKWSNESNKNTGISKSHGVTFYNSTARTRGFFKECNIKNF